MVIDSALIKKVLGKDYDPKADYSVLTLDAFVRRGDDGGRVVGTFQSSNETLKIVEYRSTPKEKPHAAHR